MKPQRTARYYYLRFIRLKGDPRTLARGVAIGVFIGITPTIPLHTVLILLLTYLLNGNTIAALLASMAVSNPLTFVPQYFLAWRLGDWLLGSDLSWQRIKGIMTLLLSDSGFWDKLDLLGRLGRETVLVMMTGGVLLALPCALAAYLASLRFFTLLRDKRRKKHLLE